MPTAKRPLLSQTEAQELLSPVVEKLLIAPHVAATETWQTFMTEKPELAAPMNSRARANMIHCWLETEVRAALSTAPGVREITALNFFAVAMGANPILRFKYLGSGGPQNVKTDQQENLAWQRYDEDVMGALALEGIPAPPSFLTCGYKLDSVDMLHSVEVRCDFGKRLRWRWPIFGTEADAGTVVEPIPLPGLPEPKPAVVSSKSKKAKEDKEAL